MTNPVPEVDPEAALTAALAAYEAPARTSVVLACMAKLVEQEVKRAKVKTSATYTKGGTRVPIDLNGERIGDVRVDPPRPGWKLVDAQAWRDWVEDRHPEHMVTQSVTDVSNGFLATVQERLDKGQPITDLRTGEDMEAPPGWAYREDGVHLVITPDKGGPEVVRRALGEHAALLGITPAEPREVTA